MLDVLKPIFDDYLERVPDFKLREYQPRGVEFWLHNPACYLAVDMGLGKTLMVLAAARVLKKKLLIIAPIRPMYTTWPEEIAKWAPELTYTICHGPDKDINLSLDRDIYLCNPEGIKWLYNALAKQFKCGIQPQQEVLVIDEGSMWKAHNTQRHKYIKAMLPLFPKWKTILSGTPSPNSELDLWAQYFILDEGLRLKPNFHRFRNTYFTRLPRGVYDDYVIKTGSSESIYELVSDITFRLDEKDHLSLPSRLYSNVELVLDSKLQKQYKQFKKDFVLEFEDVQAEAMSEASLSMKLRQFVQGAVYTHEPKQGDWQHIHNLKLNALVELMEELNGDPLLCAVQFKFEKDMILKKFPGTPFIAGGTKPADGNRYIKEWNEGKHPLLCAHPQSIGHGVNMQFGGHNALWYGLTWSLEQYLQLNKRLHRSGQSKPVNIMHLIIKDTVDQRVAKALSKKDMTQQKFLDYMREIYL